MWIRRAALCLCLCLATSGVLALVTVACDESGSPDDPVKISAGNLEGYWVEVGSNSPWPTPMHLHFGVETYEGEVPAGLPTVELNGLFVAGYELDGEYLQARDAAGNVMLSASIVSLTGDTLVLNYGGYDLTLERTDGCRGPALWFSTVLEHQNTIDMKPAQVTVRDATYGPDGALHMIASAHGGYQDAYVLVPPGRCTPWLPPLGPRGHNVDVASDGRIWVVRQRDAGELQLYEIPPQPWRRADLEMVDQVLEEEAMLAAPPATRVIEDVDGDPMLLWSDGATLYQTRIEDGAITREARADSRLAGADLTTKRLPDGVLVRSARSHEGVLYHTTGAQAGTWSDWRADPLPGADGTVSSRLATAFDLTDEGTLYAAWDGGEVGEPVLMIGRKPSGGVWETLPAGRGAAADLRVRPDGSVDVVGTLFPNGGAVTWTHLPAGFEPDTWHQSYRPATDTGEFSSSSPQSPRVLDAFGPAGEVFMGLPGASPSWTGPNEGHAARRVYQEVTLTLSDERVTEVSFPTVGVSCQDDCTLTLPVGAVVPVWISTSAPDDLRIGGTRAWALGSEPTGGDVSWQLIVPMTTTPPPSTPVRRPLAIDVMRATP